jgi:hypothetical protein
MQNTIPGQHYLTAKGVEIVPGLGKGSTPTKPVLERNVSGRLIGYLMEDGKVSSKYVCVDDTYLVEVIDSAVSEETRWQGWARTNAFPQQICDRVVAAGGYIKEAANYFSCGKNGHVCVVVYKSGKLGLRVKPTQFDAEKAKSSFFPWRVDLKELADNGRHPDIFAFIDTLFGAI